jgi:hypothetical protein
MPASNKRLGAYLIVATIVSLALLAFVAHWSGAF